MTQRYALLSSMFTDVQDLPGRILSLCTKTTVAVLLAVFVMPARTTMDAHPLAPRPRMSRQELKEEVKQAEGDRMMKARFRALGMARCESACSRRAQGDDGRRQSHPLRDRAALVRSEGGAPTVLAKGLDLVALKIREIATENDIPIVEDKPLARALYDAVQVDDVIPPEFYRAVAEIVHLLQQKNGAWPMDRRRLN